MSWDHRVVRQTLPDGSYWYSVREVFYNDDGTIYAYTENPVNISGESIEDLREYIQWILHCTSEPMLIDGEVEFVDHYDDNEDFDLTGYLAKCLL